MDFNEIGKFLLELLSSLGLKLVEAIVILFVGLKVVKRIKKWIRESSKLEMIDDGIRTFLVSFSSIVLYVALIISVAMVLGVPITSFITILASCGVAIGLALQGSLSNFAGGLMILIFKPFVIGDYIETAGESGIVKEISVVYTVILTWDNKRITIPNGTLTNSVIKNYTAEELRRVDHVFSAAYNCDVEEVKKIIYDVVTKHPLALKDPKPFVRLAEHGDNALTYKARVWVKTEDYWDVYYDIIEDVKKAFDSNGIEIPYPQLDVHVNKD